MLQPSHRGIYEYLWSEHKYSIIAVSLKSFSAMAGRLGKRPQILGWLRRLAVLYSEERPELYNALLNAYMHIKPALNRSQRQELIEALLADTEAASELIYQHALSLQEKSLYGCRLFFKGSHALYKCWDAQDKPGLWLCFGPFQLHLTPEQVFYRIAKGCDLNSTDLSERLSALQAGISEKEFQDWPDSLRQQLFNNNLVANPGSSAILHPRARMLPLVGDFAAIQTDLYTAAALVLEKLWDNADYPDDVLARLPQHGDFIAACNADFMPEIVWEKDFCRDEAWDFIAGLFWQQKCSETGQSETAYEDLSGVRMESADEKIDPKKGEHGDEKTDD